jgi:hypothetical protein
LAKRQARRRRRRRTTPAQVAAEQADATERVTIAASPTPGERAQHGERIKGLTDFIGYLGSREIDLTLVGRGETPLFHYTNLDGLKGIVENQDLWLTHAQYSNDEREITLGLDIARRVIAALRRQKGTARKHAYLTALLGLLTPARSADVYICCLCERDDVLSQWRAYGGDGNGVTLEINPKEFADYTGFHPTGVLSLWRVKYQQPDQISTMREAVEWTFAQHGRDRSPDEAAQLAKRIIDFFVPTFKDDGFEEEQEWRLIFAPAPGMVKPRFRVARSMIGRYHSLKELVASRSTQGETWRLPIRAVRIGPSRHKELNALSAEALLLSAGYEGVRVERSPIAYRGS